MLKVIESSLVAAGMFGVFECCVAGVERVMQSLWGVEEKPAEDAAREAPLDGPTLAKLEAQLTQHYALARQATELGNARLAEQEFRVMYAILHETGQTATLLTGVITREIAALAYLREDYAEAERLYAEALETLAAVPVRTEEEAREVCALQAGARAELAQAQTLATKYTTCPDPDGKLGQAERNVAVALELLARLGTHDVEKEAECRLTGAQVKMFQNDWRAAEEALLRVAALYDGLGESDRRVQAVYTYLANVYVALRNPAKAEECCAALLRGTGAAVETRRFVVEVLADAGELEKARDAIDALLAELPARPDSAEQQNLLDDLAVIGLSVAQQSGDAERQERFAAMLARSQAPAVAMAVSRFLRTTTVELLQNGLPGTYSVVMKLLVRNITADQLPAACVARTTYRCGADVLAEGAPVEFANTTKTFQVISPAIPLAPDQSYRVDVALFDGDGTQVALHSQFITYRGN